MRPHTYAIVFWRISSYHADAFHREDEGMCPHHEFHIQRGRASDDWLNLRAPKSIGLNAWAYAARAGALRARPRYATNHP